MQIDLTEEEIQVLLKMLTEDQLVVSLGARTFQPGIEDLKKLVWEKLHDALDVLHSRSNVVH
jgi:hypothetical protein